MPELADTAVLRSYLKNKFEDDTSDKENSFKKSKSPKKVNFPDKNGLKSPRKDVKKDVRKGIMACTGNKECPVHVSRPGPNWSFYSNEQDIEDLINSLNERGIRESELRNNLIHEKESLILAINDCPKNKFNPEVVSITRVPICFSPKKSINFSFCYVSFHSSLKHRKIHQNYPRKSKPTMHTAIFHQIC